MKKITEYQNKKVLVFGLALSGFNAAKLLLKLGAKVTVTDQKSSKQSQELQQLGAQVAILEDPTVLLADGYKLLVKSPGISYDNPLVKAAIDQDLPIITEPELAAQVSQTPFIGVTGTNGKTTVTTLIQLILAQNRSKGQAYKAGNIGIPVSQVVQEATADDDLVVELSSFQLLGVKTMHPHIAVLTNIYEAHLDYHHSRANYVAAKMEITKNQQTDDYFVVNFDQEEWRRLSLTSKAQVVPFSRLGYSKAGAYQENGTLYFRDEAIIKVAEIALPGAHNIENCLAAIAVAKLKGKSNADIRHVLTTFSGVEHRIQFVQNLAGRKIYNDSKATNIEATTVALQAFQEPTVWIAGGLDRGFTFENLVPALKNVKAAVFYGETKDLLKQAAQKAKIPTIKIVSNLDQAVPLAYQLSVPGDVILLSPAAASWDQFKTFEERGKRFMADIKQLNQI
ncbi:UDP-N-acetylmuramoyl-L-alanine--D-glutamate ligase [Bombilactobacillus thymidiniphilus]|uniref:UDP-N-acetylmuramoylalanine--D-glutamate ligase n=1 Tax=Bombilactobacillus thymidiniphilus TaxID=2923363 RepID=A0ABY4PDD7_9LACO|nr:UDP-N-acetylmuramoyl-L-alanine--D-glutamate ligase [Bombilactobacillus thymidiniphilus]UQS83793.1 UDP-N-acetylmuramoyl-L-alanine--D-glutamate ligase [Bombilactobacillus thymidiniphilus]